MGGFAHPYGDYNCNIPPKTVEKFLDYIAAFNPDIVVYTGTTSCVIFFRKVEIPPTVNFFWTQ